MRFITTEESVNWCKSHDLRAAPDDYLSSGLENPRCFTIGLEEHPSRVIALADYLVPTWEDASFDGALLWICLLYTSDAADE